MKLNLIFTLFMLVSLYSCNTLSSPSVRLVNDYVKNTKTYLLEFNKSQSSQLGKISQVFSLEFVKSNVNPEFVDLVIKTNQSLSEAPFSKEIFLLAGTKKNSYNLENIRSTPISENVVSNNSYTSYENRTTHVPVTTTVQSTVNDVPVTETKTEIQVVNEMVPVTNNRQRVSAVSYLVTKNRIRIPSQELKELCAHSQIVLRIYNEDNDFWTLNFNNYDIYEIKNLLDNKVQSHRISN